MPLDKRMVSFYSVRPEQTAMTTRYTANPGFSFASLLRHFQVGMGQYHRPHGRNDEEPFAYTKIAAMEDMDDAVLILLQRGSTRRAAPMLGSAENDESEHIEVTDGKMQSWSCHMLLRKSPSADGTYLALVERVPYLSRTDIQAFLNHLFCSKDVFRRPQDGYLLYFKTEFTVRTEYSFSDFLSRPGIPTDFEVVIPDARLDSALDDSFQVTYLKRTKSNMLADSMDRIWPVVLGKDDAMVRIRSTHRGERYTAEFRSLPEDYHDLSLARTAYLHFDPPLVNHHTDIHPDVRSKLQALMRIEM